MDKNELLVDVVDDLASISATSIHHLPILEQLHIVKSLIAGVIDNMPDPQPARPQFQLNMAVKIVEEITKYMAKAPNFSKACIDLDL